MLFKRFRALCRARLKDDDSRLSRESLRIPQSPPGDVGEVCASLAPRGGLSGAHLKSQIPHSTWVLAFFVEVADEILVFRL